MTDSLVAGVEKIEGAFSGLGLGDGAFAPVARMGAGFVVGSLVMEAVRPSFAYTNGARRPWAVTNPSEAGRTLFPWWVPGLITGVAFGVFI